MSSLAEGAAEDGEKAMHADCRAAGLEARTRLRDGLGEGGRTR